MRWPLTARNSRVVTIERNCPSAGVPPPLIGSIIDAKFNPIDPEMVSPASSGAANATWTMKPNARPTKASCAISSTVVSEKMSLGATIGCARITSTPIAPASRIRT